ncbi:MAG: V-type ATP synthase subunit I [Oscillospiraceae bacterium]|jgi:V/A-type H+-transporting ATPase subunit I|nr:V-type ATP synthase subunit I [Oscillospiraceae bacterium]
MIERMEKLSVFGMRGDRESLLRELMRVKCVHMRPVEEHGGEELLALTEPDTVETYALEQRLSRYAAAISAAGPYAAKRGMFEKKPRVGFDSLEDRAMLERAEELCVRIERVNEEAAGLRAARGRNAFSQATLRPWAGSPLPLEVEGTRTTAVSYCLLPPATDLEALTERRIEEAPYSTLQIVSMDEAQIYLLAVCHKSNEEALWELLKANGATRAIFSGLSGTPSENIARLTREIEAADETLKRLDGELKETGRDLYPLQYGVDAITVRLGRERAGAYLRGTQSVICFAGWVPTANKAQAIEVLERYGCCYEFADPDDDEEPPVLLKNGPVANPYEAVTAMYSLPAYRGIDPNPVMSITYFIIFGMMLGDAGFGLILFFGGLYMLKKMDLGEGAVKLVKVITMCGISTTIWGVLYGSYFGDVIPRLASVFFGKTVTMPVVFDPIGDAMTLMILCLGIGVVHLWLGLIIKGFMLVKRGKVLDALFDVGFWLLFEAGLLMWLVGTILALGSLGQIGMYMAMAGAVLLILTQARDRKNPIARIIFGIGSLYDISGFMSDVLSYSRILALGLATGVIAQVFNIIGTLPGGNIFGAILFVPVFLIGSGLNLGINTLGSYVHTARLHYVEFFGKFYEDGGRPFSPLMAQTKYIVVTNNKEEQKS